MWPCPSCSTDNHTLRPSGVGRCFWTLFSAVRLCKRLSERQEMQAQSEKYVGSHSLKARSAILYDMTYVETWQNPEDQQLGAEMRN